MDLEGRPFRVLNDLGRAGHLLEDAPLAFHVFGLVVDAGELLLGLARSARHDEDRDLLGVGPGHGIHDVVSARPVGHAHDAKPPRASRVAVCGETDGGLVGEGHDLERSVTTEPVEEPEHEIAGKPEDMRHAVAL